MKHRMFPIFLFLFAAPLILSAHTEDSLGISVSDDVKVRGAVNARVNSSTSTHSESESATFETRAALDARLQARIKEMKDRSAEDDDRREAVKREAEARRAERDQAEAQGVVAAELRVEMVERALNSSIRIALATIDRLEKIADRIESRIAKIKLRGGDVSESERLVAEARTDLSEARVSVNAIARIDLQNEVPQDGLRRVRASMAEVRELIRSAREALIQAVRSLGTIEINLETETEVETETAL